MFLLFFGNICLDRENIAKRISRTLLLLNLFTHLAYRNTRTSFIGITVGTGGARLVVKQNLLKHFPKYNNRCSQVLSLATKHGFTFMDVVSLLQNQAKDSEQNMGNQRKSKTLRSTVIMRVKT
jgi:hypothetical protein